MENLEFLTDVVPKSMTYKLAKKRIVTKQITATNKDSKARFESAFGANPKEKYSEDAMEIVEGEKELDEDPNDEELDV